MHYPLESKMLPFEVLARICQIKPVVCVWQSSVSIVDEIREGGLRRLDDAHVP